MHRNGHTIQILGSGWNYWNQNPQRLVNQGPLGQLSAFSTPAPLKRHHPHSDVEKRHGSSLAHSLGICILALPSRCRGGYCSASLTVYIKEGEGQRHQQDGEAPSSSRPSSISHEAVIQHGLLEKLKGAKGRYSDFVLLSCSEPTPEEQRQLQ